MTRRDIRVNGEVRTTSAATLVDLLQQLDLEQGQGGVAVAVNGEVVPRSRWADCTLRDGDRVEVVTAVQGG